MAFDIGINVVEVDGATSPSITGAATSVAGFNILTERGVPNVPARVTSFPQFVERFGSYFPGGKGAYLVRGFFDNGGQLAYVNRVVDPAADSAKHTFKDSAGKDSVIAEAGFRGDEDPGSWGKGLFVRVVHSSSASSGLREVAPASVSGTAALPEKVDMSAAAALSVIVDGAPQVITFTPATDFPPDPKQATRRQIVTAINAKTRLLRASLDDDNKLVLTSTGEQAVAAGGATSLQVDKANAALLLAKADDPTFGTSAAVTASGTTLAQAGKFTPGDAVVITDGTITERTVLSSADANSGAVTWSPAITQFDDFAKPRDVVVSNAEFDVLIARGIGDDDHVVETHTGLTMQPRQGNNAFTRLNHPLTGSRFVRLKDALSTSADRRPAPTDKPPWVALERDGVDGAPTAGHFIGDEAAHSGFRAFDAYNIQLLCCERDDFEVSNAALAYCANRGDAMFVGAAPQGMVNPGSLESAINYGAKLQSAKAYGALYGPWIIVPDPIGAGTNPRIAIPPTGHVMGIYARIETTRGIWKAPAGDEANLRGVLDTEARLSDADHTALVTEGGINGIRPVPRAGVVVDASRTLSTDPRWRYVNVRLLFNYVKSSLRDGLRWARQEPNRDALWRSIRVTTVTPFLLGLWRQGAFGTGTPDQTFAVIVDETNNPPDQVDQGLLTVEVYFYPSRPAETIVIKVGQKASGASVSEA